LLAGTDGTCPETVHCNATCFDSSCLYDFSDNSGFDSEACEQGHCFGFLPIGSGLDDNHDMLYQCPQATSAHMTGAWAHFAMPEHSYQHDHVDQNRHKRRRIQTDGYSNGMNADQSWLDNQCEDMFSQEAFDMALNHACDSVFDFDSPGTNHQQFPAHQHDWPNDFTSGLLSVRMNYDHGITRCSNRI
jgi:hypothetical protein